MFQVLNQIQQQIDRPVLTRRPVLIHDRVDGHRMVDAGQLVARLVAVERLHDCNGAVLAIIRASPPPQHRKHLAGMEVVHTVSLRLGVLNCRQTKAQTVESVARNVAGNETG
jgi:hypothetical protein